MKQKRQWLSLAALISILVLVFILDIYVPFDLPFLLLYLLPLFIASWKTGGRYLIIISVLTSLFLIAGSYFHYEEFQILMMLPHRLIEIGIVWFSYIILRQRIEAEDKLLRTNRLVETIIDSTNLCLAYMDKNFNFLRVNRAYAEADGKEQSYFTGKNHFDLYPDKENEEIFRRTVSNGEPYFVSAKSFVYPQNPERGVTYWDWSLIPIKNQKGETEGLLLSLSNVTGQEKAKLEADHFHKLLETLYSSLNEAVFFIDPVKMTIENCNQAAEKMFGYSKEEMIGKNAAIRHIDEDSYLQFHSNVLESYSRDGHFEAEYQMKRKDGTIFPCENYVTPIYNDKGDLIISVSIVRDITERKFSEERLKIQNAEIMEEIEERKQIEENLKNTLENLERTNKELGQFAYVASHDLQEPLRMVSTYTTLLERKYGNIFDKNAKEYMSFVVEGAKRMQMLIRELLFYSKISNKEKVTEEVDCSSIVNTAISNLNIQIRESSAKISYNDLPTIKADPLLITQLFQNLISNAIKFRRNGLTPEVNICCKEEKNHFLFSVKDNGIGIEPEYFGKIFVIFQRLHLRDKYPGTGIGLAICKKIVEQHGGEIWVESFIGQGSIFYFTLPK